MTNEVPYTRGHQSVGVRIVKDPAGRWMILLELPNGWVTMRPDDARNLAMMLTNTAEEYEELVGDAPPKAEEHKSPIRQLLLTAEEVDTLAVALARQVNPASKATNAEEASKDVWTVALYQGTEVVNAGPLSTMLAEAQA